MRRGRLLDGTCKGCGKEMLLWWKKDETENHIEIFMECDNCDHHYSKEIFQKTEDTSDAAIEKKLKQKL